MSDALPESIADQVRAVPEFRMGVHRVGVRLVCGISVSDVLVLSGRVTACSAGSTGHSMPLRWSASRTNQTFPATRPLGRRMTAKHEAADESGHSDQSQARACVAVKTLDHLRSLFQAPVVRDVVG